MHDLFTCSLLAPFSQSHAGTAAVLFDEIDACTLQGTLNDFDGSLGDLSSPLLKVYDRRKSQFG